MTHEMRAACVKVHVNPETIYQDVIDRIAEHCRTVADLEGYDLIRSVFHACKDEIFIKSHLSAKAIPRVQ